MKSTPKDNPCKKFRRGEGVGCRKCGWVLESHLPRPTAVNIVKKPKKDPLALLGKKGEETQGEETQ